MTELEQLALEIENAAYRLLAAGGYDPPKGLIDYTNGMHFVVTMIRQKENAKK